MSAGRTSEKWGLERDPLVADWLDWVAEKRGESKKTKANYLIVLHAFCEFCGKTPEQLVRQARRGDVGRKGVHRLISRYMKAIRGKGYAASTVRLHVMILRSFFASQDVVFRSLKSPDGGARAPARPLTAEEIEQVLKVADAGDRALVYVLAHSGVRVGAVPRLTMEDLEQDKVPARLRAYDEKKNVPYDTFLTSGAVEALKDYFRTREIGTGKIPSEELTAESPLIRARKSFRPMTQREIHKRITRLFKIAAVNGSKDRKVSPHSFRKFFHTRLTAGGMPESWSNILAGRVPEPGAGRAYQMPLVEELRAKYAQASEAFEPEHPLREEVEALKENGAGKALQIARLEERVRELEGLIGASGQSEERLKGMAKILGPDGGQRVIRLVQELTEFQESAEGKAILAKFLGKETAKKGARRPI